MVNNSPAEASVLEEGDQSTDQTCPVCPVSTAASSNLTMSVEEMELLIDEMERGTTKVTI